MAKIINVVAISIWILCTALVKSITPRIDETQMDTHKGSTVLLQCRFPPPRENVTCTWRIYTNGSFEDVPIENRSLSPNYKVYSNLQESYCHLEIKNVSYERNNDIYICKLQVNNTVFYSKYIHLIVLRTPSPPLISLTSAPATEGQKLELQCNTYGGNPEPEVRWYRGNSSSLLHTGRTLIIEPTREDDRTSFRCVVRNRAMREGETLDASVTLDVNYFPRVTVGPESPLKVEVNGTATFKCYVDSKPRVGMIRWLRDGSLIATNFEYIIPKVTLQDVGRYTCQADNGLEKRTEASLVLDMLYPPIVSIEGDIVKVVNVMNNVTVQCKVSANPMPSVIEWLRDGRPEFRQPGSILQLTHVTAEQAGNYTCCAVNAIHPTGGERKNHSAFASVTIRVRHKPGPARVTPDSPVAVEGSRVILTCNASPAGYPEPQYIWWKEGDYNMTMSSPTYEIDSVDLSSEGIYHCCALNEIAIGKIASVKLTVHQPPKILTKLQLHATKRVGESSFQVSCVAQGKPQPSVRWLKDDQELTADERLYKVITTASEGHGSVITVNSTLSFLGHARPQTNKIVAGDRGKYTCVFVNEVKKVESTMLLKVEQHCSPSARQSDKA